jgi:hypothetical protein
MSWIDVSVSVEITSLLGEKLSQNLGTEPIKFDVSANLEEKDRRIGRMVILFSLAIRTKPSVVKYEVEGTAVLTGKDELIDKMLEADPESKIPLVFHRIYQHVFIAMYALASTLGTVHPPPDLLSAAPQGVPVKSFGKKAPVEATEGAEATVVTKTTEETEATEGTGETKAEESEVSVEETSMERSETPTTQVS